MAAFIRTWDNTSIQIRSLAVFIEISNRLLFFSILAFPFDIDIQLPE